MNKNTRNNIKAVAVTAIMGAIGFVLMFFEFPIPALIPSFIKLDFSEIPAVITTFALGPVYGVLVCLIKNLLHLFDSSSGGVGELANFLLGAVFVFTAGIIYRFNRTRKGALIGALSGAAAMAVLSVPINYFVTYPVYTAFIPMEAIIGMYQAILPAANTLLKALLIFNMPFTFVKGIIDSAFCFIVYKKLSPILKIKK